MAGIKEPWDLEDQETETTVFAGKKGMNPYVVIAGIAAVTVLTVGILAAVLIHSHNENRALETELAEALDELERQKDLSAALEAHNNGLETENHALAERLEEFLNIEETEPVITSKQLEEQISAISELATQAYLYTNAEQSQNNKKWIFGWDMPFSEKSFIVKYDGIIKAGIDFRAVTIDVNEGKRVITVTLPPSAVLDHNVPQENVEVFGVRDGIFNEMDPNDPNALIAKGKETMQAKAVERGLLAGADEEARALIKAFLSLIPGMDTYELNVITSAS